MYFLERACEAQVLMPPAGRMDPNHPDPVAAAKVEAQSGPEGMGTLAQSLAWPARLRSRAASIPAFANDHADGVKQA